MELVALAGVSWDDELTPAELVIMTQARREESWQHTAFLSAMIHNILAEKPKQPDDFNPMKQSQTEQRRGFRAGLAKMKKILKPGE